MPDRLAALTALFEADPADADTAYMIALEHAKLGDTDTALSWLTRAIETDGEHHYAYYQKGRLLHEAGRSAEALATLDAGIARANAAGAAKAQRELQELRDEVAGG